MARVARQIELIKLSSDDMEAKVFSQERSIQTPKIELPRGLHFNKRLKMDGLKFLKKLQDATIPVSFFDPQYRGVLDKLGYGNEGKSRGSARCSLEQMDEPMIKKFICEINRVLISSGHLFLWLDKFHLCSGFQNWLDGTKLDIVDMLTWDKGRIGMGYRTRRRSEYLLVLQKQPRRAKGVWKVHDIPDVWSKEVKCNGHTHKKPIKLQEKLITAVTNSGDVVIDPASGSFSVLEACKLSGRNFLGCDING